MSDKEKLCIESWGKHFPDYAIKRWDESNFDLNSCRYVKEAYEKKKWAFVSDYARFKIINEYGGIYLDTDVEIIKNFENLLHQGGIMGIEKCICKRGYSYNVAPGLVLASEANREVLQEILNSYQNDRFILDEGQLNLKTVVTRTMEILAKRRIVLDNKKIILIPGDNIYIYPSQFFSPIDYKTGIKKVSAETVAIHHFSGSWKSDLEIKQKNRRYAICKILGGRLGYTISGILNSIERIVCK